MYARTLVIAVTGLTTAAAGLVGLPAIAAGASVTVIATTRTGEKVQPLAYALNMSSGKRYSIDASQSKSLPAGKYAIGAYIQETGTAKSGLLDLTVAARIVNVKGATKVAFDVNKAKRVFLGVDDRSVRPLDLAVVPFATVKGKPKKIVNEAGIKWPATGTYVLPSNDAGLSLGVHGILGKEGDEPGPVRYDLAKTYQGIPADVSLVAKKKSLARVDLNVSVVDALASGFLQLVPATAKRKPITGLDLGVPVLGKQISYRTPGLQWATTLNLTGTSTTGFAQLKENYKRKGTKPFLYAAGKTYRESWGQGVWGPRANSPAIFKQGGKVQVRGGQPICPYAGVGVTLDDCQFQPGTFSYRLERGGSAVGKGQAISTAAPATPAWYTAVLNAKRENGDLMQTVDATWYFRAGAQGPDGPLGAGNLEILPAGLDPKHLTKAASTSVGVTVVGLKGVRSVEVEYSTDGGKTWKKAKATGKGAKWSGKVANPDSGAVSLRVTATAASGAYVKYTVTQAYGVA
ncbi:MAG: hypothetical protein ACT4QG_07515 [Sporichthyaceae bacterium]